MTSPLFFDILPPMPLYTVTCRTCKTRDHIFRKIDDRDSNLPVCCDNSMERIIEAAYVRSEIAAYESPAHPGKWVTSRAERRNDLAASGCIEWEPGLTRDVARNRQRTWEQTEKAVDHLVDSTVRDLEASGRLSK